MSLQSHALLQWLQGPKVGYLARAVNVLLVLWIAYLLAQFTWQLVPGETVTASAPVPLNGGAPTPVKHVDVGAIAQWHLFGKAGQAPAPVQQQPTPRDAPETRLKLTLRGLFASDIEEEALAIIADPKGNEKPYRIGDPLPGGAELKEIYPDRIILMRSGRYETLKLPRDEGVGAVPNGRAPPRPAGRMPANLSQAPGERLKQYRQALKQNPQSLVSLVRPQPVRENGQFVGFRLLPGKERGFLQEVGLRPGDIVTGINGTAIDGPAKGMQALGALQTASTVNLDIKRGGRVMAVSFEIPQ